MAAPGPSGGPGNATSAPAARPSGAEDLRLPKPPGFIRSYFNRHPWLLDGLIAGSYLVPMGGYSLYVFGRSVFEGNAWYGFLFVYATAAVTVGLLFRRYVPVITAAISAASLVLLSTETQQLDAVPMMFALYALAVYRNARSAWLWTAIAVGVGVVSVALSDSNDVAGIVGYAILFAMFMVIATLVGITFGNRRRYILALLARAEQLGRERDQQAQLSAAAERARIAREMHDIVAHSLTVIVALSDGAEASVDRSPDTAREAMRQAAITARRALTDMRRTLGVLTAAESGGAAGVGAGGAGAGGAGAGGAAGSTDAPGTAGAEAGNQAGSLGASVAPLTPQPGLDDLPELIASYRAAGLPVRYTTTGEPPRDPLLQLTVYRVVQEALTNALRYAVQATAVEIVLSYRREGSTIEVHDDGIDPARGAASAGSGRGLIGMRERVAVYGGTVSAGPAGTRGWRVHAALGPASGTTEPVNASTDSADRPTKPVSGATEPADGSTKPASGSTNEGNEG